MMDIYSVGLNGQVQSFSNPLFQTLGMFVGMFFGLIMHYIVIYFKISFPGYDHENDKPMPLSMWLVILIKLLIKYI